MSSRGKTSELCRICGGGLQGNQRRWLFGGQHRKTGSGTPTRSPRGGSLSQSSQSSPWGSTLSLASSGSLSRSQLSISSSPSSKPPDLLAVLTHILGQSVARADAQSEFVCGKCACALERVFKFDAVISRVKVLSSERLQKLTQERDKIRQWVRQNCRQRRPGGSRGSASEDDGESEKEGYREMLRDNMSLSEFEWWSERWDTCPYFIRTGKRCRKGKGCEGCNSLRVSDSNYESVCGVPRNLPFQPFSPLSRDKSRSMPLHWQGAPSLSSGPASLASSCLSLRASSRTASIQSLDSLDGPDPFDQPSERSVGAVLRELRGIEGKQVSSPSGSRIPVMARGRRKHLETDGGRGGGTPSPSVSRTLSFGENGVDREDGEDGDVLTELRDDFMPLHRESTTGRVHHAIRHLRGQLDQALSRVRTLEAELKKGRSQEKEVNSSQDLTSFVPEEKGGVLLQSLGSSLHSRERLIQECLCLIRGLGPEGRSGPELSEKLTQSLKEILSENQAAVDALRSETSEWETATQSETAALRKAGRERERDLDTLNVVLQCNQDVINDLRVALGEKEQQLKEVEKERELWRQRDGALGALLQEKEALILLLQEQVEKSAGGGAKLTASQLKQQEEDSAALCLEVMKLTTALQEYQEVVQSQQESHSRSVSALTSQLQEARRELREKESQRKEAQREEEHLREEEEREESRLKESLRRRDQLIEQILQDAERRDFLFGELQQNLQSKREPVTAVKHTL